MRSQEGLEGNTRISGLNAKSGTLRHIPIPGKSATLRGQEGTDPSQSTDIEAEKPVLFMGSYSI